MILSNCSLIPAFSSLATVTRSFLGILQASTSTREYCHHVPVTHSLIIFFRDGLGPNQICTLYGAAPGQDLVIGRNYVNIGFGLNVSDIWRRNFLVVLGFLFLFQLTQVVLIEYFPHFDGGSSVTIYAPEDNDTKKRNERLRERKERRRGKSKTISEKASVAEEDGAVTKFYGKPFTWENINYYVPVPGGTRRLLHDVFGYVKPGTMTALMGASGAGKSSSTRHCSRPLTDLQARRPVSMYLLSGRILVSSPARCCSTASLLIWTSLATRPTLNRWMSTRARLRSARQCASPPTFVSPRPFRRRRRTSTSRT